jgi:hypothetical protein
MSTAGLAKRLPDHHRSLDGLGTNGHIREQLQRDRRLGKRLPGSQMG